MSATTTTNGKPQRKQLSDQLDRLDGIIDALAEGLNQAVADAAREGTRLAVKDAIIEIMTNPDLRALFTAGVPKTTVTTAPPEPEMAKPSLWARIKAKVAAARTVLTGARRKATVAVTNPIRSAISALDAVGKMAGEVPPWKRMAVIGAVVGLVVCFGCLLVPHTVAAVVGGIGAAFSSVAVQAGSWLKRAARRFGIVK